MYNLLNNGGFKIILNLTIAATQKDNRHIFNLYFYTVYLNEHFMMLFGIKNGAQNVVLYLGA